MNGIRKDGHELLAAGQVGTQVADVGRACMRIPPLRQGQAALRCCAACDALGLRRVFITR